MATTPIPLVFAPGVQRDGTRLDTDSALDSLWTRWRLGRPRSMGGFSQITDTLNGVPRKIHMFYTGAQTYIHVGTSAGLQQVVIDQNGNFISIVDRTPIDFAAGPNVGWTLDAMFDSTSKAVMLLAHAVPDLRFLSNSTKTKCFLGQIKQTTPLSSFSNPSDPTMGIYTQPNVAGGICAVQPYAFDFDIDGSVGWSAPNQPNYLGIIGGSSGAGNARVSAQKVVAGMALRGGGVNSPAALFWSLSEVISAQFVGSANGVFAFNTVSPSSSILSQGSVIEYDGLYFWAGVDRFLVYNGTVVEVPNKQNLDFFFDNMNWENAAKTFAFKIPRFGEIWWCAPLFGASEPNHAVIYNLRENVWYDTPLPNSGRSSGYFAQGLRFPVMGGSVRAANGYPLWLHETGTDQVVGRVVTPIRKYYQTPYLGGLMTNPPSNEGVSIQQFEPDMVQTGDMIVTPTGTWNPRVDDSPGTPVPLPVFADIPQEQIIGFKFERRLPSLIVESNTLGGSFITGKNHIHGSRSMDSRKTGGSSNPR